jgi:hypothetical protein
MGKIHAYLGAGPGSSGESSPWAGSQPIGAKQQDHRTISNALFAEIAAGHDGDEWSGKKPERKRANALQEIPVLVCA